MVVSTFSSDVASTHISQTLAEWKSPKRLAIEVGVLCCSIFKLQDWKIDGQGGDAVCGHYRQ